MLTEPFIALTDYAIALESGAFAGLLLRAYGRSRGAGQGWWAAAFAMTAIAAALGGTSHGFQHVLSSSIVWVLWRSTLIAIGLASGLMLVGTVGSALRSPWHVIGLGLMTALLWVYSLWVVPRWSFTGAIATYGSSMGVIMLWLIVAPSPTVRAARRDLLIGILVSGVAAIALLVLNLLRSPISGDGVYHLIQMVALAFFYRGALQLNAAPLDAVNPNSRD
ncbi:DUF6962 family protein [Leptolyngbya sp. AN02str]|uniref:DUF6962 family protein n=1 Tax=Leptolyngbya sp. AN02str TaxID=3423363 RepID=UPI003D31885E